MSPLETGTASILPPPPPPPLVSKSFVPDKKTDGSKKSSLSGLVEPEDSQVASQSSSHTGATASKTLEPAKKRTIKRNYLKPHNGCELHKKSIAAVASSFTLCQLQAAISCYSIKQTNKFFDYLFLTSFSLDDTHGLDGGAQVCDTSGGTVHRPSRSSQRDQLGSNERETVIGGRHEDALVLHQEGGACATRIVGVVQSATFLFSYLFFLSSPFFPPPPT